MSKSLFEIIILYKAPKNNKKPESNSMIVTINNNKGTFLFSIESEKWSDNQERLPLRSRTLSIPDCNSAIEIKIHT